MERFLHDIQPFHVRIVDIAAFIEYVQEFLGDSFKKQFLSRAVENIFANKRVACYVFNIFAGTANLDGFANFIDCYFTIAVGFRLVFIFIIIAVESFVQWVRISAHSPFLCFRL